MQSSPHTKLRRAEFQLRTMEHRLREMRTRQQHVKDELASIRELPYLHKQDCIANMSCKNQKSRCCKLDVRKCV